jgi:hypothetical protein
MAALKINLLPDAKLDEACGLIKIVFFESGL